VLTSRLGDCVDFSNGGPPHRVPKGPFPVYGANGAIGRSAHPNARGPLIVLGRVGSYCGSMHYCDSDVWVTDNALACRAKEPGETRFWYYALQTCRLNSHRAGSGQPALSQRILGDVPVPAVPEPERPRIAGLLGALDDRIAANDRVVAVAEALMVVTVEGITVHAPLSELADRSATGIDPGEFDDVVAHFSLPAFDGGAKPRLVRGETVRSGKFLLSQPCVLFAKLNPRIPRIWNVSVLPDQMALASTEFVVLRPAGVDTSALWAALRASEVSEALRRRVAGTSGSRQRIQPRDLLDVRVRDVRTLSAAAARTVTGLGVLCHARRQESARLAALRDELLPLLISGQVRVGSHGM
jgi:hypothetical protein